MHIGMVVEDDALYASLPRFCLIKFIYLMKYEFNISSFDKI